MIWFIQISWLNFDRNFRFLDSEIRMPFFFKNIYWFSFKFNLLHLRHFFFIACSYFITVWTHLFTLLNEMCDIYCHRRSVLNAIWEWNQCKQFFQTEKNKFQEFWKTIQIENIGGDKNWTEIRWKDAKLKLIVIPRTVGWSHASGNVVHFEWLGFNYGISLHWMFNNYYFTRSMVVFILQ